MANLGWGVCRLSVVAVRESPHSTSEQTTQLLFGEHYSIQEISEDKKWVQIRVFYDQSEGWLHNSQHHAISEEFYSQICHTEYKIATEITSQVLYKKNPITVVLGSIIPISTLELFSVEEQIAFNGDSKPTTQRRDFEFLRSIAKKYLWSPYSEGGKTPFGIDAAGFVQMTYKISGYSLLRNLDGQSKQGKQIAFEEIKPGDLAFFKDNENNITNAGIIFPENKVIHSHAYVRIDNLTHKGVFDSETNKKIFDLHSIRRVI